jgi:GTP-binding protein
MITISKSDMLDDELKNAIKKELPKGIPILFISSLLQKGLNELKDALWNALQSELQ